MDRIILKSVEEEAADCRKAFEEAGSKIGDMVNFCHHEQSIEPLYENPESRINYITNYKPESEKALRLRMFRPAKFNVKLDAEDFKKAMQDWKENTILYAELDKDHLVTNEHKARLEAAAKEWMDLAKVVNSAYAQQFQDIFGTEWTNDIFSTFPHMNAPEPVSS